MSHPYRESAPVDLKRQEQIESAVAWLELAGRVTNLSPRRLVQRARNDDNLVDAVLALLATSGRPGDRLGVLRDFLITQELGELDPHEPVTREPSPFHVPLWILDEWFPPGKDGRRHLRPRQFYDCLLVGGSSGCHAGSSIRLFGNANIGEEMLTNLQVAGQLSWHSTFLATSWWISTLDSWSDAEAFFAHSRASLRVGDKRESTVPAMALRRERQCVLLPIPLRQNFAVDFSTSSGARLHTEGLPVPVYVFIEGWTTQLV